MRTVVELVHIDCEDPLSILNVVDNKEKTIRKQLGIHIRNCKQALEDVEASLKRYTKMSAMDKVAWVFKGHDEVNELESNLSSFATQLDSFVNGLTLKGVGAVYQNQRKIQRGIGRIEEALEKTKGNDKAAVQKVMQEVDQSNSSPESTERYKSIIADYAHEVSCSTNFTKPRAQTPDPTRGRKDSTSSLAVPVAQKRAKSADTSKGAKHLDVKSPPINKKAPLKNKPKHTLECWLIQIKSGHLTFLTWQLSEKEIQCRGQWKLEEMAQQFKSSKKSKLKDDHGLVDWVLKDRNKAEEDSDYLWRPYAAKIEQKGSLALNLGVEEQAMMIIQRRLTVEALKKVDEKQRLASAKKEAAQKKAKKENAERKAKEAAGKNAKEQKDKQRKADQDSAKKDALIKKLEEENEKLKVQKKGADAEIATENVTENVVEKASNDSAKKAKNWEKKAASDDAANAKNEKGKADKRQANGKATAKKEESKVEDKIKGVTHKKNSRQSEKKPFDTKAKKHDGNANPKPVEQKKATGPLSRDPQTTPDCWDGVNCTKDGCPYTHHPEKGR